MPFETLHDWYAQFDSQYKKVFWNGEIYANPSKSRYSNEDNHLEIRFARYADVRKGDYIIDEDRVIYLLDWVIGPESNNKPSRCLRCNAKITFKKYVEEEVSWEGKVIKPQHWDEFVKDIPCNAYRYEGRPQFSAINGTPGISANALTVLSIQYNEKTKNIQIGDVFTWGTQEYIVIDVNLNGMDISGKYGMLTIQARMSPGGDRSGEPNEANYY